MRLRRWIANFFLVTGLLAIILSAGAIATAIGWQDWENWVFDQDSRNEPATIDRYLAEKKDQIVAEIRAWRGLPVAATPSSVHPVIVPEPARPPSIAKNGILGRLTIQRLHLSAIVREGDEESTLSLALGHIPGTPLPGAAGNVGIAGHRDTLFRGLRNVRKDDVIQFETLGGTHVYKVASIEIVKPQEVSVLNPGRYPELTLVTCYPFYYIGSAPDRFIVKARQVSTESLEQAPPDSPEPERPAPPAKTNPVIATSGPEPPPPKFVGRKIAFNVSVDHSLQLAPGISLGVTETDTIGRRVDGWMWLMPDRRTIWIRSQKMNDPLVFYSSVDGQRHELFITGVTKTSVTGYLIFPDQEEHDGGQRAAIPSPGAHSLSHKRPYIPD